MTMFAVPGPVKTLFDQFPVKTYPSVSKRDDAMSQEFAERTYDFQGPNSAQDDVNDTFTLGVYNVFHDSDSNLVLATDPWCLYAQLSLCKKNALNLPQLARAQSAKSSKPQQKMALLSPLATQTESLPILVEGYSKRFVRSSESIHETLKSRATEDPQQLMYISLLDRVIYDCWITQVLYHLEDQDFLKLYSYSLPDGGNPLIQRLVVYNLKLSLIKRNQFHLRHKVLTKNLESTTVPYKPGNLREILDPILNRCQKVLVQFNKLLKDKPFKNSPTYLELKIASYVLCILNLPTNVPLKIFVEENCSHLVNHSRFTLDKLKN